MRDRIGKWTYSMIADLREAREKYGSDITAIAQELGISKPRVNAAIQSYLKPESAQYKRRMRRYRKEDSNDLV